MLFSYLLCSFTSVHFVAILYVHIFQCLLARLVEDFNFKIKFFIIYLQIFLNFVFLTYGHCVILFLKFSQKVVTVVLL